MKLLDPKALSLLVLTLQNTCLVLTMRVSRTRQDGPMYLASVAVMTDELMKLVVCTVMLLLAYRTACSSGGYQLVSHQAELPAGTMSLSGFGKFFKTEIFVSVFDFFKMVVPALCYALQKNMLYVAVSNLDAAVFQVAYQGKILTTALFSVIVLGKKISSRQIFALFILLGGVILVQLSTVETTAGTDAGASFSTAAPPSNGRPKDNVFLGSIAVLIACCTSGFAAVYFEWVLKKTPPQDQKPYSLWVRNFQLAIFAGLGAGFAVWSKDGSAVAQDGLYQGFTPLVWVVVTLEAFGGIVVALVIKYADNILKNFATAVSIVTSVIVSTLFLGFQVRAMFVFGGIFVMAAVAIYTSNPKAALFTNRQKSTPEESIDGMSPSPTRPAKAGLARSTSPHAVEMGSVKSRAPHFESSDSKAEI